MSLSIIPVSSSPRMLRKDKEEAEAIKHAKALEEEKAMYSVREACLLQWAVGLMGRGPGPCLPQICLLPRAADPGDKGGNSGRRG